MENVARIGIDLAKKVFHVTAMDAGGAVVERKRLRRGGLQSYLAQLPRGCAVAMEACGGAHHWARLASRLGHRAVLMSPRFVAPYVKSNKNDVNDADGIAEASARPSMRFVPVKSAAREHVQQLHRARQMAVRNRTAQGNQIHGFLLEYGRRAARAPCCAGWRMFWRMRRTSCRSRAARCCGNWATSSGASTSGWRCSMSSSRAWRGRRRRAGG